MFVLNEPNRRSHGKNGQVKRSRRSGQKMHGCFLTLKTLKEKLFSNSDIREADAGFMREGWNVCSTSSPLDLIRLHLLLAVK